jgi:hypothetical protein
MREKCVYLSRGQLHCYLILHLWARRRPKALKIVKAESFRDAFFVVGNGQVFGLFGSIGISFLVLCLALQLALGFFSLFLLPLPLFLSLCKGRSGASSHEHSWYYRILRGEPNSPPFFILYFMERWSRTWESSFTKGRLNRMGRAFRFFNFIVKTACGCLASHFQGTEKR